MKGRRGTNTAIIAVARGLLEIVYYVWKEKRPYFEKASMTQKDKAQEAVAL